MKRSLSLFREVTTAPSFGSYEILRPRRGRPRQSLGYPPSFVPPFIKRPPYVPRNFFVRQEGEALEEVDEDLEEGYHGENGEDLAEKARSKGKITLGGVEEETVRYAGRTVAEILQASESLIQPGRTTAEIDQAIHRMILARGAYPSPLGYQGFPKSVTSSVNNVICHGIPDDRPLQDTDIINIDITIYTSLSSPSPSASSSRLPRTTPSSGPRLYAHGDTSRTFLLPQTDNLGKELVECTREALMLGVGVCGPGVPFREIGRRIDEFSGRHGFSVNQQFTGHGIGQRFHTAPWILHYRNDEPGIMQPGHCFTVEPCLVQGDKSKGFGWSDGWTYATISNARSAQFEHQVLIAEDGVDILTKVDVSK